MRSAEGKGRFYVPVSVLGAIILAAIIVPPASAQDLSAPSRLAVLDVGRSVDPISASFVRRQLQVASSRGFAAVVVSLSARDTSLTATDTIVESIANANLPVVVYVPSGAARMTSASLFVAMAAPVFAVAPDVAIGGATPGLKTSASATRAGRNDVMAQAVTNIRALAAMRGRNADLAVAAVRGEAAMSGADAAKHQLADFEAVDIPELLTRLNGRSVGVGDKTVVLQTAGAEVRTFSPAFPFQLLSGLIDPNVAYALFMIGVLGILVELSIPGIGVPGIVGAVMVLLSLLGFGALPINITGVALVLFGIVLFVLEIKLPTHGILTAGGLVSILVGSFLVFPPWEGPPLPGVTVPRVSTGVILAVTGVFAGTLLLVIMKGARAQRLAPATGKEVLLGKEGKALTDLVPKGVIQVSNEEWTAISIGENIYAGEEVLVVGAEGVHLVVVRRF